mmetsp:Transcript_40179/g.95457  ORF Transcript_40179/g.95457 Transcript_40179/m.95457 type:complete len:201 (+) Transcript_40179:848-1450(+)
MRRPLVAAVIRESAVAGTGGTQGETELRRSCPGSWSRLAARTDGRGGFGGGRRHGPRPDQRGELDCSFFLPPPLRRTFSMPVCTNGSTIGGSGQDTTSRPTPHLTLPSVLPLSLLRVPSGKMWTHSPRLRRSSAAHMAGCWRPPPRSVRSTLPARKKADVRRPLKHLSEAHIVHRTLWGSSRALSGSAEARTIGSSMAAT